MKLFEITPISDTVEHVFHYSKMEAIQYYMHLTNISIDEFDIKEIPQSQWASLYVVDPDIQEPDEDEQDKDYNPDDYIGGFLIEQSFEELAEELNEPMYLPTE